MKFTYLAPIEYNDLSSGFKTIESEYHGPHDFKVYVDPQTRLITRGVEFDHDGHPEIHGGTDMTESPDVTDMDMIYLHSHNPNHIALMAMICNHEGHQATNIIEVVDEKYNMVYQRWDPIALDHTYDLRKCTIDENGIVTYAWWQMVISWPMLVNQGKSHRNQIVNRLHNDVLTKDQRDKANYCIEIIDYVILNEVSSKHPWKIAWPSIETVTLDNSVPIGMVDGVPNPDRNMPLTESWGATPHEIAYHIEDTEDEEFVLDAICPTTAEEAAKLAPWDELHDGHPSHSRCVACYLEVQQSLIDSNPDIHLTADMIQAAYNAQKPFPHHKDHPDNTN
jgi:hypothetical protein